jgi:hypothetical protein
MLASLDRNVIAKTIVNFSDSRGQVKVEIEVRAT